MRALTMAQLLTRGELTHATNFSLILPTLVSRQATWEYDLALCLLESGSPDRAAEYFTRALKLVPELVGPTDHCLLPGEVGQTGSRTAQEGGFTAAPSRHDG